MSPMPASPYGPKADAGPPGLAAKLLGFCEELRSEGVAVGTSEILDAFAALEQVAWTSREDFREALAATIAKSQEDRRVFELLFERWFFRAAEAEAVEREVTERGEGGGEGDAAARAASGSTSTSCASRSARRSSTATTDDCATWRGWRSPPSAARARARAWSASTCSGSAAPWGSPPAPSRRPRAATSAPPIDRDQLNSFERHLRRELERDLIERTETLPPSRPLAELDRALPTSPTQDLAAVHRAVSQMKRRLATLGHEQRGRPQGLDGRRAADDAGLAGDRRRAAAARYRPKRPRRPEIYVLCDVSTSVTSASVFFLSVLHALHDSFRKLRSFVFIERISEVTESSSTSATSPSIAQRISSEGGVADVSGYTDYGRVWLEFLTEISDELDPRSTVIVLGDARTNGREPHAEVFAQVAERAGRLFWLNPEPKLYWNYGDSVMAAYERYCDGAFECWTTRHLENFVNVVAGGVPARRLRARSGPSASAVSGRLARRRGRRRGRLDDARHLAGDEVGEGDVLEHRAQAGADGDPDLLQVLGVAVVLDRLRRGRLHVGDRALDGADDIGDRHLLGRPGQPVAALGAAAGADDALVLELEQDVLEELQGDVLGLGQALALDRALPGGGQLRGGPHRVVGLR